MSRHKWDILGGDILKDIVVGKYKLNMRYRNTPVWPGSDICVKTYQDKDGNIKFASESHNLRSLIII